MKKILLIAFTAFALSSCLKGGTYYSTQNVVIAFDEIVANSTQDKVFEDDDQEYAATSFFDAGLNFFSRLKGPEDDKVYTGGFSIARLADTTIHRPSYEYPHCTVFGKPVDKDTINRANVYAVYRDEPDTSMMPKASITYAYALVGTASASAVFVNNTVEAVAAFYGGAGFEPFKKDDWFKVTFRGKKDGEETGSAEQLLFDWSGPEKKVVTEWTKVDLAPLGNFDTIDILLSSSKPDYPHYVCIDNLCYTMVIGSKD